MAGKLWADGSGGPRAGDCERAKPMIGVLGVIAEMMVAGSDEVCDPGDRLLLSAT